MSVAVVAAGSWTSPPLDGADEAVAAWAAGTLAERAWAADALALATLDSGARESVGFWREALDTGLRFANPRAFPWTLANSPAGRLAQELDVRGPTYTLIGRTDALVGALDHAFELAVSGNAATALLVALDSGESGNARLAALALSRGRERDRVAAVHRAEPAGADARTEAPTASETLARVLNRLAAGTDAVVGAGGEACFRFVPRRD